VQEEGVATVTLAGEAHVEASAIDHIRTNAAGLLLECPLRSGGYGHAKRAT
jgi:hypothetical protein